MDLPDIEHRTCNQCLWNDDSPQLETPCPGTKDGKHRWRPRQIWVGVVVDSWFDVRSPETAKTVFGEGCYLPDAYVLTRRLSPREIAALREDRAELVLKVSTKAEGGVSGGSR